MQITVTITGGPQVQSALTQFGRAIESAAKEELHETGYQIVTVAQGDAAVDTGEMRDGVHVESETGDRIAVRASAEHSSYLDFGTSRMSAQPFFTDNANRISGGLAQRLGDRITRVMPR